MLLDSHAVEEEVPVLVIALKYVVAGGVAFNLTKQIGISTGWRRSLVEEPGDQRALP